MGQTNHLHGPHPRPMTGGVLEEVLERVWPLADSQAGPGQQEAPSPPCPWCVHPAQHSCRESHFQRCSLEGARCCWDVWTVHSSWRQLRALHKLFICCGGGGVLQTALVLEPLIGKLPCLLNLPPARLGGSACLFSLCPLCMGANWPISDEEGTCLL